MDSLIEFVVANSTRVPNWRRKSRQMARAIIKRAFNRGSAFPRAYGLSPETIAHNHNDGAPTDAAYLTR